MKVCKKINYKTNKMIKSLHKKNTMKILNLLKFEDQSMN